MSGQLTQLSEGQDVSWENNSKIMYEEGASCKIEHASHDRRIRAERMECIGDTKDLLILDGHT